MLLTDLGAGEYTKEYFHEGRYRILCNNSFGHSVPVIDGEGQKEGGEYSCSRFEADFFRDDAAVDFAVAAAALAAVDLQVGASDDLFAGVFIKTKVFCRSTG